jgi:Protein of unknown function (DUF2459)
MLRPPAAHLFAALSIVTLLGCQHIAPPRPAPAATSMVYVVRRAWHIDIGFAAGDLQPPLRSLLQAFPPAAYLEFGFGDRHYLMTRGHGPANLMAAIWPGKALVLMTALRAAPQKAFGASNVVMIPITSDQAGSIQAFVWQSLSGTTVTARTADPPVADGPYPGSIFYAATIEYSGLHTCNTWAAEALQSGGLPLRSTGVLFAGQLWSQVRRLGTEAPAAIPQ